MATLLLPVGVTEHGPHLPLSTDTDMRVREAFNVPVLVLRDVEGWSSTHAAGRFVVTRRIRDKIEEPAFLATASTSRSSGPRSSLPPLLEDRRPEIECSLAPLQDCAGLGTRYAGVLA